MTVNRVRYEVRLRGESRVSGEGRVRWEVKMSEGWENS